MVENSQGQIEDLQKQVRQTESRAQEATTTLEATRQELDRALPFEKEVKEKNLLIGKLRHEAVILNDHLTKALRYLKKGRPEDTIDKYRPAHELEPRVLLTLIGNSLQIISCTFWLLKERIQRNFRCCKSLRICSHGAMVRYCVLAKSMEEY